MFKDKYEIKNQKLQTDVQNLNIKLNQLQKVLSTSDDSVKAAANAENLLEQNKLLKT